MELPLVPYLFVSNNYVHALIEYYKVDDSIVMQPMKITYQNKEYVVIYPPLLLLQGALFVPANPTEIEKDYLQHLSVVPRPLNMDHKREIIIATDGGCWHNGYPDAVASWAFVIDAYYEFCGPVLKYELDLDGNPTNIPCTPTNNRGEFRAIIEALWLIVELGLPNKIFILSDSGYVKTVFNNLPKWVSSGKINTAKNKDLVLLFQDLIFKKGRDTITFQHINSHQDNLEHEPIDVLPSKGKQLSASQYRYLNRRADELSTYALQQQINE